MNYSVYDLSTCDREPIHILGRVQSHGWLVAADRSTYRIGYISNNIRQLTTREYPDFLDKDLGFFFGQLQQADAGESLFQVVKSGIINELNPVRLVVGEQILNMIVHTSGDYVVLEFEPSTASVETEIQSLVGSSLSKILQGKTLQEILDAAAGQIADLIGYDRVMIYKFWEDGHGEVLAESKKEELEPFLGLHYPASDIPKPARDLYKINLTRIIADVGAETPEIVSSGGSAQAGPLDLTYAVTRAVSNIHIQYLKNMGVQASFSVSLLANDGLWGLIACHNYRPRFIDYKTRQHAKLIGQVLSSSIQYISNQDDKEVNINYRNVGDELIRRMQEDWSITDALVNPQQNVLQLTAAGGAAVLFEGKTYLIGETPEPEQVEKLAGWLRTKVKQNLFHTHQLPGIYPPAVGFKDRASGLLASSISRELGEYVLFFKPERTKTVNWAGNPEKTVETGEDGVSEISPRHSFAVWTEEIRGSSEKWSRAELNSVFKFREDLVHFINLKANEIRKLNERLKEAYDELDTFSFTISHDLKTPIASIRSYAELLLEDNTGLTEKGGLFLDRIIKSVDKMNGLIREVMGYSRMSRQPLNKQKIHIKALLEEIQMELIAAHQSPNLRLTIGECPVIFGDKVMISQVFTNLISNAIKYSVKSDPSLVRVEGAEEGGQVIYKVSDNGIGIDMNYGAHIFELFKRMDNVREYEGSGVGLAIVKRIMEKHNARIWFESEPGEGTVFYLSFQKV